MSNTGIPLLENTTILPFFWMGWTALENIVILLNVVDSLHS
jgi:hypothetical protein